MRKPLHKFVKKFDNGKGTKWSCTFDKEEKIVNTWNGTPPIEDEIKKPTN